ncbi:uncharacterized protein LOC134267315 [Saccostrea cucullata]|uniref:uncharacterized protein LOC134267315 n=1 Tax=Saccostrea cuccullata TaxID=36930 RepID=UPI002ED3C86F
MATPYQNIMAGTPGGLHPILQQIDQLNALYTTIPLTKTAAGATSPTANKENEELVKMQDEGVQEAVSSEVFSVYQHREIVKGCCPHPGDIVEAGPLAALSQPDPTYPLTDSLPEEVIREGKLSSLQLEGVLYACQQHMRILPSGQRAGFFIGDAAGVGKGRQISGIIFDNYARGRTKHIWFTISSDLIVDSRRDLSDIGCHVRVIDGCQELDRQTRVLGLPADFKEGVVFSTYATLVSSVQRGVFNGAKQSRLQQLVNWCGGEEFDGCLVFDECHKAKNFVPGKEQASTKVALAVTTIQRLLPKARVLYCSATGVTDVKNMAFMERLGLWGVGAQFRSFEQFIEFVQKKGLGMAEMLAMEMKMSGMYVSRGLSYKQAEFSTVEIPLTEEQRKIYDTAAHVWNELKKALESAIVRTNYSGSRIWSQFWSCHQRFFKHLCIGMKIPTIVKEAQTALENGCCVVIGLQSTGEASFESEFSKNKGKVSGFVSLCKEIFTRFITQHFPIMTENQNKDEVLVDEWSKQARDLLLGFAEKINLPNSPLDDIIDKLGGPNCVAEMTGRKGRIVRNSPEEMPRYELRTPNAESYGGIESLNVQERNMFMEGRKLVAIISDAASTGISLHADVRCANQRRRIHLTVELPWSADKAVQQLGRSHRSNQSSGPMYKLLTTDLGGERRFAAAVARRLQSLGALTKGDRRAASGADLTEFNFDTPYGRNALRAMYQSVCTRKILPGINMKTVSEKYSEDDFLAIMQESLILMGLIDVEALRVGIQIKDRDAGDVSRFLNRILGLSVAKQNCIFKYFIECMTVSIDNAKSEGRYNEGLLDITASSVEMVGKPKEVFKEFNKNHAVTNLVELNVDRGMSWEMATTRADNYKGKHDGFYISKRDMYGRKMYLLATQKEGSSHLFTIARPNTGLSQFDEEKTDLFHRYSPISREKAESVWKEQYKDSKDHCMHGRGCKHGRSCRVGSRCYTIHLLCGNILSHMSTLESTLSSNAHKLGLSKSESNIRVVRVKLNNGERVVGIRYPAVLIPHVEKTMKEKAEAEQLMLQANGAAGSSLSLTQPDQGQVTQVIIEKVTPVNQKCKARALRPPVTIKNFFKPASFSNDDTCSAKDDSGVKSCDRVETPTDVNKKDLSPKSDHSKAVESGLTSKSNSDSSKISRKRPFGDMGESPVTKRQKQSNLATMFANVTKRKKETSNKLLICPICKQEFKDISNVDLNAHIDNCLIE